MNSTQSSLFDAPVVQPARVADSLLELASRLRALHGIRCRFGTSSWYFPGWAGIVWDRAYPQHELSRHGLWAYAQHPLLRSVSLDRAFYRPVDAATAAELAARVDEDFRFVVKAPALVCDALHREAGKPMAPNPLFLDASAARDQCAQPLAQGFGAKLGAVVFQLSPLPTEWRRDPVALHARLEAVADATRPAWPANTLIALELRDPELLTPRLAALLKAIGWRYCLGLHDRMPPIDEQLPLLRALWPGDLVCRWNLRRGQRYAEARDAWAPFDRLQAPDLPTRQTLGKVIRATLEAGHCSFVTINNKAEGSAPLSVIELARLVLDGAT